MEIVFDLLNHWLIQTAIILTIIGIPTGIVLKNYFNDKFQFHKRQLLNKENKVKEMNTITGKLKFVLENPDLAYEKLNDDITEANEMISRFKDNNEMREVFEGKKKNAEWELQIVSGIMKHKTYIDFIGSNTLIPMVGGLEKRVRGLMKGALGSLNP